MFLWYTIIVFFIIYHQFKIVKSVQVDKLTRKESRTILSSLAFYLSQTFLIVTMLIVGGMGSVSGAVVGTVVITVILKSARH